MIPIQDLLHRIQWDFEFGKATDTAFYRYPHYHAPIDTPERLNYPAMARVASGLQGAVAALAGA